MLRILDGISGHTLELTMPIIKIGKTDKAQIPTQFGSRVHAVIEQCKDDVTIVDLGNEPGTFLNGCRINKAKLRPGDRFSIGDENDNWHDFKVEFIGDMASKKRIDESVDDSVHLEKGEQSVADDKSKPSYPYLPNTTKRAKPASKDDDLENIMKQAGEKMSELFSAFGLKSSYDPEKDVLKLLSAMMDGRDSNVFEAIKDAAKKIRGKVDERFEVAVMRFIMDNE